MLFIVCVLIIIVDQLSKAWVRSNISLGEAVQVIPNFLEFKYTQNTGMAFSMFADQPGFLTILVVLINIILIVYIVKYKPPFYFGFIVGGALGNLLDRFTLGYVTDFINPLFIDFAVFNIADASLNVGVGLFVIDQIRSLGKVK